MKIYQQDEQGGFKKATVLYFVLYPFYRLFQNINHKVTLWVRLMTFVSIHRYEKKVRYGVSGECHLRDIKTFKNYINMFR